MLMDSHDAAYDLVKEHKDVRSAYKRDGAKVSLRPLTREQTDPSVSVRRCKLAAVRSLVALRRVRLRSWASTPSRR